MSAQATKRQAIEAGDFVSNAPLRARCQWLMDHDPEFNLVTVCLRLADLGYPTFWHRKSSQKGSGMTGDTTHLLRLLGIRDQTSSLKKGRRYSPASRTQWIPYELAVAVARALDLDPHEAGV